ncbi:hypothetical protein HYALB_00008222 [Hymenoscyphus albidus]|uniref:Mitochondrial import inner membrane translocase subunit TIM54 n=1 Tax=Hymenoscyphus albidus TaxID=595503 RepID=A0A9N9Q6P8_9HELO|nr:hypothetical protein HYALB_00008222 [Hymenoscyphus albidus]
MADSGAQAEKPAASTSASVSKPEIKPDVKPLPKPNPIYKYMGLGENFRPKLPSRNWTIFLTLTGSFTAAVIYDKRETRRVQRKWCRLVEHLADEPLDSRDMPRKLTVFLEAPPNDGLRSAQEHFKLYVKPILVASGLDWEFVQGRKEGDIRADFAERIRNSRTPPDQRGEEDVITQIRRKNGIQEFEGPRGDIVIGRHTWKEYVRGLHEGWLGPLTEPVNPLEEKTPEATIEQQTAPSPVSVDSIASPDDSSTVIHDTSTSGEEKPALVPEEAPKGDEKPKKPPPFIPVADYSSAPTPSGLPAQFDPSTPITFPHILGFLNTPRRIYRFLNRRDLADSVGRETAAIVLANCRPYSTTSAPEPPTAFIADDASPSSTQAIDVAQSAEQQNSLFEEEKEWHKSVRIRKEDDRERTWLEPVILDPRIASRMRRFKLSVEDEDISKSIVVHEEEVEGWIKGGLRRLGRSGKQYFGFGTEKQQDMNVSFE